MEVTAGDFRGPKGKEVAEGLELEGASGQLGKRGISRDFSVDDFSNVFTWLRASEEKIEESTCFG